VCARNQLFSVAQALAFLSQGTTLMPGSMLMTGTPAGVGFTRTPPVVLRHGDVVETSVGGGIGTLINTVVEEGKGGECV
jgi:2-keto-4-pentenoate hydratase/2-oxohepta-3-ene-1,7-dioic acid hydratase in catechol pathway